MIFCNYSSLFSLRELVRELPDDLLELELFDFVERVLPLDTLVLLLDEELPLFRDVLLFICDDDLPDALEEAFVLEELLVVVLLFLLTDFCSRSVLLSDPVDFRAELLFDEPSTLSLFSLCF